MRRRELSGEAQRIALFAPRQRQRTKQLFEGQRPRLTTFGNCRDDVGRKVSEPKKPSDIKLAEIESRCDCGSVGLFPAAPLADPVRSQNLIHRKELG